MKKTLLLAIALAVIAVAFAYAEESASGGEAVEATLADSAKVSQSQPPGEKLVVYYLHSTRRCATCRKLEAYSFEALHDNFKEALEDSSIIWRVVNFEEEGNEHFVDDYKLFTQSLILSRVVDGKETEWKNLDQIWKLVGDKEDYLAYVVRETHDFLNPPAEQ